MSTWINVARYHMVDRFTYLVIRWASLAFSFAINLVIFAAIGPRADAHQTGGLATIYVFLFIGGLLSVTRSLPFGLALGLSRRSYYLGTVLFALALAVVDGLALTVLQVIERATAGWGEALNFFRVPWILDGPWYLTWLTSFVVLTLVFVYGMWFGLVYRRWNLVGLVTFCAGQTTVVVVASLVVTWTDDWHSVGHFLTNVSIVGLTGVLAAFAALLLAGGFATMHRVTV